MTIGFPHSKLVARLCAIASLSHEDAARIAQLPIRVQNLPSGHDIAREGDHVDQCCMLVDGYLMRHKIGPDGKRQVMSWHVPGDIPDLYSLHLNPMDHNLTTLGPAVVGYITHEALNGTLNASAELTHIFWRETLVDASVFREWVVNLGKRGALARIAHMLCELLARLRMVGLAESNRFSFPASQTDIADATGMTPVHANRMIQQLRAKDFVIWDGANIHIPDPAALATLAEFDDSYLHHRHAA